MSRFSWPLFFALLIGLAPVAGKADIWPQYDISRTSQSASRPFPDYKYNPAKRWSRNHPYVDWRERVAASEEEEVKQPLLAREEDELHPPNLKPLRPPLLAGPKTENSTKLIEGLRALEEKSKNVAPPTPPRASEPCMDRTVPWERQCASAGYPAYFSGIIKGETRFICAQNIVEHRWIGNSCAPPVASKIDNLTLDQLEKPAVSLPSPRAVKSDSALAAPQATEPRNQLQDDVQERTAKKKAQEAMMKPSCGAAVKVPSISIPREALCDVGSASKVKGRGPWRWTCVDKHKHSVACVAQKAILAQCGTAHLAFFDSMPRRDLCKQGIAGDVTGQGPWVWICDSGIGGSQVACTAQKKPSEPKTQPTPVKRERRSGNAIPKAIEPRGEGPPRLLGTLDARDIAKITKINGACGAAHGAALPVQPSVNLCAMGVVSAMRGTGPWTWDCLGGNGGMIARCGAAKVATLAPAVSVPSLAREQEDAVMEAKLATPKLPAETLPPLDVAAAQTMPVALRSPKLDQPLPEVQGHTIGPGVENYAPTPPIRSVDRALPRPGVFDREQTDPVSFEFDAEAETLDEESRMTITALGRRLAAHKEAGIVITAYAGLDSVNHNTRRARQLSLARALTVRDLLIESGADNAQIKIRALGANVGSGWPDRVDLSNP